MPCNHRLDADYVGLFCPYCGDTVAEIANEQGQLVLRDTRAERARRSRYVAVIHGGKQRAVNDVQMNSADMTLSLSSEANPLDVHTPQVLMAFQDPEEKLEL